MKGKTGGAEGYGRKDELGRRVKDRRKVNDEGIGTEVLSWNRWEKGEGEMVDEGKSGGQWIGKTRKREG